MAINNSNRTEWSESNSVFNHISDKENPHVYCTIYVWNYYYYHEMIMTWHNTPSQVHFSANDIASTAKTGFAKCTVL